LTFTLILLNLKLQYNLLEESQLAIKQSRFKEETQLHKVQQLDHLIRQLFDKVQDHHGREIACSIVRAPKQEFHTQNSTLSLEATVQHLHRQEGIKISFKIEVQ